MGHEAWVAAHLCPTRQCRHQGPRSPTCARQPLTRSDSSDGGHMWVLALPSAATKRPHGHGPFTGSRNLAYGSLRTPPIRSPLGLSMSLLNYGVCTCTRYPGAHGPPASRAKPFLPSGHPACLVAARCQVSFGIPCGPDSASCTSVHSKPWSFSHVLADAAVSWPVSVQLSCSGTPNKGLAIYLSPSHFVLALLTHHLGAEAFWFLDFIVSIFVTNSHLYEMRSAFDVDQTRPRGGPTLMSCLPPR